MESGRDLEKFAMAGHRRQHARRPFDSAQDKLRANRMRR